MDGLFGSFATCSHRGHEVSSATRFPLCTKLAKATPPGCRSTRTKSYIRCGFMNLLQERVLVAFITIMSIEVSRLLNLANEFGKCSFAPSASERGHARACLSPFASSDDHHLPQDCARDSAWLTTEPGRQYSQRRYAARVGNQQSAHTFHQQVPVRSQARPRDSRAKCAAKVSHRQNQTTTTRRLIPKGQSAPLDLTHTGTSAACMEIYPRFKHILERKRRAGIDRDQFRRIDCRGRSASLRLVKATSFSFR